MPKAILTEEERRRLKREKSAAYAAQNYKGSPHGRGVRPDHAPSADLLAERDAGYLATRSLTAEFCGDPLPGRSALDQRGGRV